MASDLYKLIFDLRMVVGYLGEKSQNGWWGSSFLTPSSKSFLSPVFSKTTVLAQYHGVCQAASLIHDEFIGLGVHYHLYRLPDSVERMVAQTGQGVPSDEQVSASFTDTVSALSYLEQFCAASPDRSEGPVIVGDFSDKKLKPLTRSIAAHYFKAFSDDYKCYPYLRCS